jgi:hypothetical protein
VVTFSDSLKERETNYGKKKEGGWGGTVGQLQEFCSWVPGRQWLPSL